MYHVGGPDIFDWHVALAVQQNFFFKSERIFFQKNKVLGQQFIWA
jgi:hypothetical protein